MMGIVMTGELKYIFFNTDAGWVGALSSEKGLRGFTLPQRSAQEVRQLLGANVGSITRSPHLFQNLVERFKLYFSGHKTAFPDKLDLSGATTFQREVWEATRLIPFGETRSYSWVAEQIGKPRAVRAVGRALGRNPLPVVIPCHRVIASDGGLGGYGGGMGMKKYLLQLEASVSNR